MGTSAVYEFFLAVQFDKIVAIQDKLVGLEDAQVELHLLRSCLNVCKVTHLYVAGHLLLWALFPPVLT